MRYATGLWLALLLVLTPLASAVTLQVARGNLISTPEFTDNCMDFSNGESFHVGGCSTGTRTLDYDRPTPEGDRPLLAAWSFELNGAGNETQVGALQCSANGDGDETCGRLTLTHGEPMVLPADWDRSIPFTVTVPFTLTGFLVFAGGETLTWSGMGC